MSDPLHLDLTLRDAEATADLGRRLAALLCPGDTVLIDGPIGAGKTHLARAAIQALLAAEGRHEEVPSPTFTLVQTYDLAAAEVVHADLYRLGGPEGLDDIGLSDQIGRAICLIEWPDRLGNRAPADAISIALAYGKSPRRTSGNTARRDPPLGRGWPGPCRVTDRDAEIAGFLDRTGWAGATRRPLAGDASNRRYLRLTGGPGGAGAVLMDAPPDRGEDVRPFVAVAEHLTRLGFSAPRIYEQDAGRGFLLIEDLGDALYARVLARDPGQEAELYAAAVDLVADLALAPLPDFLTPYAPDLVPLACLAFDWYQRGAAGSVSALARADFAGAFTAALNRIQARPEVLIQRDYHAENLIWLPDRRGTARVGLLDFQDARSGHPVYDLISLLEDARRDVGAATVAACRERFRDRAGLDPADFGYACATIALQRNLRILGVFARLSLHYGKPQYVDLIPRVWRAIEVDLAHPDLAAVAVIVRPALPEPDADVLARLKALCGTVPTR